RRSIERCILQGRKVGAPVDRVGAIPAGRRDVNSPMFAEHRHSVAGGGVTDVHRNGRRPVIFGAAIHPRPGGASLWLSGLAASFPIVDAVDEFPAEPEAVMPNMIWRLIPR